MQGAGVSVVPGHFEKQRDQRQVVLQRDAEDFERLADMVVDGLGRHLHLGGDLLVGHALEAAHLEDAPGLLGELGERLAVEPCEFRAEVEVRGVELVGESLFQLLVDA